MTGEYSSGTIRSTLAAVPARGALPAAKAAVFGLVALLFGEALAFVTVTAGRLNRKRAPPGSPMLRAGRVSARAVRSPARGPPCRR